MKLFTSLLILLSGSITLPGRHQLPMPVGPSSAYSVPAQTVSTLVDAPPAAIPVEQLSALADQFTYAAGLADAQASYARMWAKFSTGDSKQSWLNYAFFMSGKAEAYRDAARLVDNLILAP